VGPVAFRPTIARGLALPPNFILTFLKAIIVPKSDWIIKLLDFKRNTQKLKSCKG
jgi:hypothetical protein